MEKDRFFGVGEPLIQRQRDQGIDAAAYLDLVAGLGCTAYRSWMHITEILDDPSTPNPEAVAMHTKLPDRVAALTIEVTGMSHEWFLPEDCEQRSGDATPPREMTPGSLYMKALFDRRCTAWHGRWTSCTAASRRASSAPPIPTAWWCSAATWRAARSPSTWACRVKSCRY